MQKPHQATTVGRQGHRRDDSHYRPSRNPPGAGGIGLRLLPRRHAAQPDRHYDALPHDDGLGRAKEVIVRVPFNQTHLINAALDAGADGVIVPLTNTPEAVEQAVQAAKFPPRGVRSWGPKGAVTTAEPKTTRRSPTTK